MSKSMFESSKVALAFAGVTLVGAAIFASTIGDDGASGIVPEEPEQRERMTEAPRQAQQPGQAAQPAGFSDYVSDEELGFNSFADDGELIDSTQGADTSGFSTNPGDTSDIITSGAPAARSGPAAGPGNRAAPPPPPPGGVAIKRPSSGPNSQPRVQPKTPNDLDVK